MRSTLVTSMLKSDAADDAGGASSSSAAATSASGSGSGVGGAPEWLANSSAAGRTTGAGTGTEALTSVGGLLPFLDPGAEASTIGLVLPGLDMTVGAPISVGGLLPALDGGMGISAGTTLAAREGGTVSALGLLADLERGSAASETALLAAPDATPATSDAGLMLDARGIRDPTSVGGRLPALDTGAPISEGAILPALETRAMGSGDAVFLIGLTGSGCKGARITGSSSSLDFTSSYSVAAFFSSSSFAPNSANVFDSGSSKGSMYGGGAEPVLILTSAKEPVAGRGIGMAGTTSSTIGTGDGIAAGVA